VADTVNYRHEPLGIMYLSAAARAAGHQTEAVLSRLESPVDVADRFRPNVLAFTATTGTHHHALRWNIELRKALGNGVFSAFGGPHATFFPELIDQDGVDACCVGEGEEALVELLDTLEEGGDPSRIANWIVRSNGSVHRNDPRPLADNLDSIAFPDRALLAKYGLFLNSRVRYFMSSRGCPYKCTYCFNHIYHEIYRGRGKVLRKRSVENLVDEIKRVRTEYPLAYVRFIDDVFVTPNQVDWLEEFAARYSAEVGLPFLCYQRLDHITPEIAALLKMAGCVTVLVGLEAGNDELREVVLKRRMSRELIVTASRTIREQGIHLVLQNMLALPRSRLSHDLETLDLNIECRPDYSLATLYQPYPRTELGEIAYDEGYFHGDFDDIPEYYFSESVLDVPEKSERVHLQKIFAVVVQWPFLRPLVGRLVRMPHWRAIDAGLQVLHLGWKWLAYRRTRIRA
jgi:radical SAM superfamily enzyme YgiQ (UPF0313 family)